MLPDSLGSRAPLAISRRAQGALASRGLNRLALCILALLIGATQPWAENIDPDEDGSRYAYGENVGWLSAEQDVDGDGTPDQGVDVSDESLTGWLWGENVGWVSMSCETAGDCRDVDYGVANDGCGVLSGHAWSENLGWIRFLHTEGGVAIDPRTGHFSGEAWSENAGWIRFASTGPNAFQMKTSWVRNPPVALTVLTLAQKGTTSTLTWASIEGASTYDVVQGDLGALQSSGDFTSSTQGCHAEDLAATTVDHEKTPLPGQGYWFLVRGANCGGNGSYDSAGEGQDHPRDSEIDAASGTCL